MKPKQLGVIPPVILLALLAWALHLSVAPRLAPDRANGPALTPPAPSASFSGPAAAGANALQVGVLFLYNSAIVTAPDSGFASDPTPTADSIDGRSKAYIESGNLVLTNSGVTNFQWKYLGSIQAKSYPIAGNDALAAISPGGVIADWVITQAYHYGAAQVISWEPWNAASMPAAGYAQTAGQGIPVQNASMARAAVSWRGSYKTVSTNSPTTLAHSMTGQMWERAREGIPDLRPQRATGCGAMACCGVCPIRFSQAYLP